MREELKLYSDKIMKLDLKAQIKAKVACARLVQHLMKDKRSLDALDVCDRFVEGKASRKELDEAAADAAVAASAYATYAAYYAAYASDVYYAAYAAYDAAFSDAYYASDAYGSDDAASEAAGYDIIKKCISIFKSILREEKLNEILDEKI
jgi:hypothetical protein